MPFVCPTCGGSTFRTLQSGSERECTGVILHEKVIRLAKPEFAPEAMMRHPKDEVPAPSEVPAETTVTQKWERRCPFFWAADQDEAVGLTDVVKTT